MPLRTHAASLYLYVFLTLFVFTCAGHGQKGSEQILKEDLQRFGYTFQEGSSVITIDGDLAFLSDDLLLVSVRESPGKTPLSKMLLFNVKEQKLVRSMELPVRKVNNAVVAIQDRRFVMLSDRGWQICSVEFICGEPWASAWLVFVSPDGSRATVGRFGEQPWVELNPNYSLLESWQNLLANTQVMMQPPNPSSQAATMVEPLLGSRPVPTIAIAGEPGWLVVKENTTFAHIPGRKEVDLGVGGHARFADRSRVIGTKKGKATLVALDGAVIYQIPSRLHPRAEFITCSSGERFGIFELGYRGLSSLIDFGDESGAYNLGRVRVFDVASGRKLFDFRWNPGHNLSWVVKPVMSPDGHRVAVVMKGELRVYEIP